MDENRCEIVIQQRRNDRLVCRVILFNTRMTFKKQSRYTIFAPSLEKTRNSIKMIKDTRTI